MKEYASIETLYVRNPLTHALDFTQLRVPEADLIRSWAVTEKVDGMNIRAIFRFQHNAGGEPTLVLEVKGRTDTAQLPGGVEDAVRLSFDYEKVKEIWLKDFQSGRAVTFYGEAFGEKIQKNPLKIQGIEFRVFDILIGANWWLNDVVIRNLESIVGYKAVPIYGLTSAKPTNEAELNTMTLGGESQITPGVRPEGIVCRPHEPLFDTFGNRVIWKLTYREFDKIRQMQQVAPAPVPAAEPQVETKVCRPCAGPEVADLARRHPEAVEALLNP